MVSFTLQITTLGTRPKQNPEVHCGTSPIFLLGGKVIVFVEVAHEKMKLHDFGVDDFS